MFSAFHRLGLSLLAALLAWSAVAAAQGQAEPSDDEVFAAHAQKERARIDAGRKAVQADAAARQQACRQRFFVNPCIRDARDAEREALAALRRQEVQIDEAERTRRRDAALQRSIDKKAEMERPPAPLDQASRERQAAEQRAKDQAEREAQARERLQRQEEREREAERRRQAREDAARERAKRPATPALPDPAGPTPR